MSTLYYKLKDPFRIIQVEAGPFFSRVEFWTEKDSCGALDIRTEDLSSVLLMFADNDYPYSENAPIRTHWGGNAVGCVVTEYPGSYLSNEDCLIDECGCLTTVRDVRSKHAAGRGRFDDNGKNVE